MKPRLRAILVLLLSLLGSAGGASAQTDWRDLPPEERRQLRQQMRQHWQQDKDVQREVQREDGGRRWRDVPPEDRRRMREEMRDQRAGPAPHEGHPGGRHAP